MSEDEKAIIAQLNTNMKHVLEEIKTFRRTLFGNGREGVTTKIKIMQFIIALLVLVNLPEIGNGILKWFQ